MGGFLQSESGLQMFGLGKSEASSTLKRLTDLEASFSEFKRRINALVEEMYLTNQELRNKIAKKVDYWSRKEEIISAILAKHLGVKTSSQKLITDYGTTVT